MCRNALLLSAVAIFAPCVHCWGATGHATIATIANSYLTSEASSYVSSILGSGTSMASVASWADDYRETSAGAFSAPFHFIDAEDNPPTSCSVDESRDCGSAGCVVTAIANYTSRVQTETSKTQKKQALEFIIHFLGDVTQPLHDEAEALGGNEIPVTWKGKSTNLHACWDTQMVEELAGGSTTSVINSFAANLTAEINSGKFSSQKASWIACSDISTAEECALEWAQDANKINCEYVLKKNETDVELSGAYYEGAIPYLQEQLAKGGYRLGTWINALADAN